MKQQRWAPCALAPGAESHTINGQGSTSDLLTLEWMGHEGQFRL